MARKSHRRTPPRHPLSGGHSKFDRFRFIRRRDGDKLLGLWAAEKLVSSGTVTENYAKDVVDGYLGKTGEHHRLRKDFDIAKVNISDAEIRQVMNELLSRATELIQADK